MASWVQLSQGPWADDCNLAGVLGAWRQFWVPGDTEASTHETGHSSRFSVRASLAQASGCILETCLSVHGPEVRAGARESHPSCILKHMLELRFGQMYKDVSGGALPRGRCPAQSDPFGRQTGPGAPGRTLKRSNAVQCSAMQDYSDVPMHRQLCGTPHNGAQP